MDKIRVTDYCFLYSTWIKKVLTTGVNTDTDVFDNTYAVDRGVALSVVIRTVCSVKQKRRTNACGFLLELGKCAALWGETKWERHACAECGLQSGQRRDEAHMYKSKPSLQSWRLTHHWEVCFTTWCGCSSKALLKEIQRTVCETILQSWFHAGQAPCWKRTRW